MNFLAEILATADVAEMTDLNTRMEEFAELISNLKADVMSVMEGYYLTFRPVLIDDFDLTRRAENLNKEIEELMSRIENQINRESAKVVGKKLRDALKVLSGDLTHINHMLDFHMGLLEAKRKNADSSYLECSRIVHELNAQLHNNNNSDNTLASSAIFVPLCRQLERVYCRCASDAINAWTPLISWLKVDLESSRYRAEIGLKVSGNLALKQQLVGALNNFDLLALEVRKFSSKLLESILKPIIDYRSRVIVSESGEVLRVSTRKDGAASAGNLNCGRNAGNSNFGGNSKREDGGERWLEVLAALRTVFEFLHRQLDVNIDEVGGFLMEVGREVGDEFCDYLIDRCLARGVPIGGAGADDGEEEGRGEGQMRMYRDGVRRLIEFEALLHEKGFLSEDNHRLLEYTENINILRVNRLSECYLQEALAIMKGDLFDIMEVGKKSESSRESIFECVLSPEQIEKCAFEFPSCKISKNAEAILRLIEKMLIQAISTPKKLIAATLFRRVREIVQMYCSVVPLFNRKLLESEPQNAAFLHNNCYYIAYRLPLLIMQYKEPLSTILSRKLLAIGDLVPVLTSTGAQTLRKQLFAQKKPMIETLKHSGLVTVINSTEFGASVEAAIRKVCGRLRLLQCVWQNVLNDAIYSRAMGYLCNVCLEDVIQKVSTYPEISQTTRKHLIRIFNMLVDNMSSLFEDQEDVKKSVKYWSKFKELIFVLDSGLKEVEERWNGGKGPLAQEFTAPQITPLIRAVFTASTRRAAFLASIK